MGAPRLDLDDASVGEGEIERAVLALAELGAAPGDEARHVRGLVGCDLAARDLEPDQFLVGKTHELFARRQGAEQVVEVAVAEDQALAAVEQRDGDAQAMQRLDERGRGRVVGILRLDKGSLRALQVLFPLDSRRLCASGVAEWLCEARPNRPNIVSER